LKEYVKCTKHDDLEEFEINNNEMYIKFKMEKSTPKTWKDKWQKPLNQGIIFEETESPLPEKIRTEKISRRRDNRRNNYIIDILTYEE